MNRTHFTLASALLALVLSVPFGNSLAAPGNNDRGTDAARAAGALTLPIAGSVAGGGEFNGTVTVNRFARQNGQLVAIGFVRGAVTSATGAMLETGLRSVTLPVTLASLPAFTAAARTSGTAAVMPAIFRPDSGGRWTRVQAQTCGVLHLALGPVAVDLLGVTVSLGAVTLDISGDSASPLGALACQVLALLGTAADVVGLLNAILGLLTGLLGGLTGGLGA